MIGYVDYKAKQARAFVGKRVQIPVHYTAWMMGARCGVVTSIGKDGAFVRVKLDNTNFRKLLKVWRIDFDCLQLV